MTSSTQDTRAHAKLVALGFISDCRLHWIEAMKTLINSTLGRVTSSITWMMAIIKCQETCIVVSLIHSLRKSCK